VVPIFVPALRERVEDIPLLTEYFVSVYCAANGLAPKRIEDDAMLALKKYAWPGNVRELENAVQRMVIMTDADQITSNDLPAEIVAAGARDARNRFRFPSGGIELDKEVDAFEKRWLQEALQQSKQVKADAARLLGVDRNRLNYLCRKHSLQ
jgi:DNA-binding NtrC family response regulator